MINFSLGGSTDKTQAFLTSMKASNLYSEIDGLAQRGVAALAAVTPTDTGLTASSWSYEIDMSNGVIIRWFNTHVEEGANIAILLQYGHGTGTGGYVSGLDYINPAIKPIFDEIADSVWEKVTLS